MWTRISGGVYKNWCLDALEGSVDLNLIILAAATFFVNTTQEEISLKLGIPLYP